jgi:hypothetical protein
MKITEYISTDDFGNQIANVCVDYEDGNFLWTTKENWNQMVMTQSTPIDTEDE